MAIRLLTASNQGLNNAAPAVTAYPFTVGIIAVPFSTGIYTVFGGTDVSTSTWAIYATGSAWRQYGNLGTPTDFGDSTMLNRPYMFVYRAISSTNRRTAVLQPDGSIAHASDTTSAALGNTVFRIGIYPTADAWGWDGLLSEFWYTDTDIQGDGAQLSDALIRQIYHRGPFSVPRIRKDIVEYRSFRGHITENKPGLVYFRRRNGPQTWTNTNTVTNAPHVPHAVPWNAQYVRPDGDERIVPVYVPSAPVASGAPSNMLLLGVGS